MPKCTLEAELQNFYFARVWSDCLTACCKTQFRYGQSSSYSHNSCTYNRQIHESVFQRRFVHCTMLHLFILPCFFSSSISLTEGEKCYKEGVDQGVDERSRVFVHYVNKKTAACTCEHITTLSHPFITLSHDVLC